MCILEGKGVWEGMSENVFGTGRSSSCSFSSLAFQLQLHVHSIPLMGCSTMIGGYSQAHADSVEETNS